MCIVHSLMNFAKYTQITLIQSKYKNFHNVPSHPVPFNPYFPKATTILISISRFLKILNGGELLYNVVLVNTVVLVVLYNSVKHLWFCLSSSLTSYKWNRKYKFI